MTYITRRGELCLVTKGQAVAGHLNATPLRPRPTQPSGVRPRKDVRSWRAWGKAPQAPLVYAGVRGRDRRPVPAGRPAHRAGGPRFRPDGDRGPGVSQAGGTGRGNPQRRRADQRGTSRPACRSPDPLRAGWRRQLDETPPLWPECPRLSKTRVRLLLPLSSRRSRSAVLSGRRWSRPR